MMSLIILILFLLLLPLIIFGIFYALIANCVIHKKILLTSGILNPITGKLFGMIPFGTTYQKLPPTDQYYGCCKVQDCIDRGIEDSKCEGGTSHGCRRGRKYRLSREGGGSATWTIYPNSPIKPDSDATFVGTEAEPIGSGPVSGAVCQSTGFVGTTPGPIRSIPTTGTTPTPTPTPRSRTRVRPTGCPTGKQLWAGLCYNACPAGSTREGMCRCSGRRMSCRTYGAGRGTPPV